MWDKWWQRSTVYQIYPLSFKDSNGDGIGDVRGIISKLDYLKNLGVDVLWLSPIYQSPMDDNGYDISDYYKINECFGTMEDADELIKEAHNRNLKVIFDLVVNHVSDEHPWFMEAKKSKDNKYRDYFIWRDPIDGGFPTDQQSVFSGPVWEYSEETGQYFYHIFSRRQPDLNWENEDLRKEIYTMMNWWMDKGLDGFRMDVIDHIGKEPDNMVVGNGPRLDEYLNEMYENVFKGRTYLNVGETPCADTSRATVYTKGPNNPLDMIFTFQHMGLDEVPRNGKWKLKDLELRDLKDTLGRWQTDLYQNGWNSLYWSNHDQPRIVSRFGNTEEYREKSAKMLATLLHFMQGTPYIYQGEEIGMTNIKLDAIDEYKDIETLNMYNEKIEAGWSHEDIMKAVYTKGRDNARTPVQWDDSPYAGFSTSGSWIPVNPNYKEINIENALRDPNSIYYYYKKLIELRKNLNTVTYGNYEPLLYDHPEVFAYKRRCMYQEIIVISNFYGNNVKVQLPKDLAFEDFAFVIGNDKEREIEQEMMLSPYEAVVFIRDLK